MIWAFDRGQKRFLTKDVAVAERRGARLGMLFYRLDKKHRERTHSNLELAFPEWTPEKRDEVAKAVFRHYGLVMGDFLRTPMRTKEEVLETAEVEGFDNFLVAEAAGKGVLVVTAHLGNFERFGHYCTATGRHISVVARDANQSEIQERIAAVRANTGVEFISRGEAARPIMVKLRRKELIGLLPDQNTDEAFVPFFGKPCGTVLGPAVLHQRTGAPILPAFCVRTGVGRYKIIVKEPIDLENTENDREALMTQVNSVLESVIRDYPEQWLWMHDRWKSARLRGLL
ncbi:lipid A biosynthesis acyltransferase [Fimbriimonas ginsengisoli Gsoil 348]|uniref:Lipid A biosynthesis acyltransferase n=1 Tax=Fimbriimonas ginsengisoli Gsoil 348 TaxID=661478 RepID=A0A068NNC0_FIMGI|nr:lipid A biosynthesis acyltransferase [Fimbriimonas ginsengisoli Gsoil 348]